MEEFYLADKKFLAGNSISIADLLYSCELDEMRLLDGVEQVRRPTPLCAYTLPHHFQPMTCIFQLQCSTAFRVALRSE